MRHFIEFVIVVAVSVFGSWLYLYQVESQQRPRIGEARGGIEEKIKDFMVRWVGVPLLFIAICAIGLLLWVLSRTAVALRKDPGRA